MELSTNNNNRIIIEGHNSKTKIYNKKLFDFLSKKHIIINDMELKYVEKEKNLYYYIYQNPPRVFSITLNTANLGDFGLI